MFLFIYSFNGLMWSIPFLFEKFDGLHRLFEYQHLAFFASGGRASRSLTMRSSVDRTKLSKVASWEGETDHRIKINRFFARMILSRFLQNVVMAVLGSYDRQEDVCGTP